MKSKKILSLFIACIAALALFPATVFGNYGDPAIVCGVSYLETSFDTDGAQLVCFGDTQLYVVGYDGQGVAGKEGCLTLFAEGVLDSILYQDPLPDGGDPSNTYQDSILKKYLDDYTNDHFSDPERQAAVSRYLEGGPESFSDGCGDDTVSGDAVDALLWPLSVHEAKSEIADHLRVAYAGGQPVKYWLRSPGYYDDYESNVEENGDVSGEYPGRAGGSISEDKYGVRPAFYLNMDSVLFTFAANGGKTSGEEGPDALVLVGTNDSNTWKCTLKDKGRGNFTADAASILKADNSIDIAYDHAVTDANEWISALIADSSGKVTYYGRIKNLDNEPESGTVTINLGGKYNDGDMLYVFNEHVNDESSKKSDYSSDLQPISVVKGIYDINLTIRKPACGTEVSTPSEPFPFGPGLMWDWSRQTNKPQITFPATSLFAFAESDDACVWIDFDPFDASRVGLNTTMSADSSYLADIFLDADSNCLFGKNYALHVEGAEVESQELLFDDSQLHIRTRVTPVHELTEIPAVAATCTNAGNIQYYVCGACRNLFADSDAKTEISDPGKVVIPALGHKWKLKGFDWTGNDTNGYKVTKASFVCQRNSGHEASADAVLTKTEYADYTIYAAVADFDGKTYSEEKYVKHNAVPTSISNAKVQLSTTSARYTGKAIKPKVTLVTLNGITLNEGTDYTVSYQDNVNIGTAFVVIIGKGSYMDAARTAFAIYDTGWQKNGGKWYYVNPDGSFYKGWLKDGGKWYYLGKDGAMVTGWQKEGGSWYYLGKNGAMVTGWQKEGGSWYYLGKNGVMVTGWRKVSGEWYYLGSNGAMVTGWQKEGGSWYYLGKNGVMRTGWQKVSGKWYYLGSNGVMRTGWQKVSGEWYYLGGNGVMRTGWQKVNGNWYYLKSNGVMVTGTQKIDGKTYKFKSNGVWVK